VPNSFDRTAYPSIPQQLWVHYDRLCKERPQHRLVEAVRRQGAETTWRAINEIVALASQATRLPPNQLFVSLGFNVNDLDSANFQAMLGILRSINKLTQLGFTGIQPLRPLQNRQEADFLAKRNGRLYSVEVFRSSEEAYKLANHNKPSSDLATYIERRLREKLPQVRATMGEHSCAAGMVVVVMDSYPSKALNDAGEYHEAVRVAFEKVSDTEGIHVLLFTGMVDMHGNAQPVCYPPL
jgi:hypothetical protein